MKMSKDIIETEMYNGILYDKEEKVARTKVVEELCQAGETVFTVNFNKKVDDAHVKSVLNSAGNNPDVKKLAKEIAVGKEASMTCYLTSKDSHLGRSSVISLDAPHGMNFRQVDHRTINWLVLKNTKYTVK